MRLSLYSLLLSGVLVALSSPITVNGQIPVDRRRAVTSTASLRIMGGFSELRVIGWDKDSVAVVGKIPKGSRFEGNFAMPQNEGPAPGMKMYLELPDETQAAQAQLTMYIPSRARLWVKGGSANVSASGIAGSLDINVIGGSVQVSGAPRELTIEAMDASVRVEGSPEWARVKTATGDV